MIEEKVKTFWGHLKPLTVKLTLPVRGYVPGQVIPVKALVNNDTGVEISKLRIFLKKVSIVIGVSELEAHLWSLM